MDESYKGPFRLPDFGTEDHTLFAWRDRFFNRDDNPYRRRHMERMAINLHYTIDQQDVDFDSTAAETSTGYSFSRRSLSETDEDFPRPVTNYVDVTVSTEMAALSKRKLVSKVVPTKSDPKVELAAKGSSNILQHILKRQDWTEKRKEGTYYFVTCGTVTYKTFWDETYTDTKRVGSPEATRCPDCGTVLSSPFINTDQRAQLNVPPMGAPPVEDREDTFLLLACPQCPEGVMKPYEMSPEEMDQEDMFGRSMGQDVPRGDAVIELVPPFERFVENNGVGVTPSTRKLHGQATARSLDWIVERYPDIQNEDGTLKISPDPYDELIRYHPLLGEYALRGGSYYGESVSTIYDDHKIVFEAVHEKSYRFPQGRYLVMVKDRILEDGPLYVTVEGPNGEQIEVPKVQYHDARYKIRAGEFFGRALPDILISSQNVLNGLDAQIIDALERMGSPNLTVPSTINLQGPEWWESYGAGKIMTYEPDIANPQARPEVLEGKSVTASIFTFRDAKLEDMRKLGAPKDVEMGEAPRNITTTTGLQLLAEQADRLRADAEEALVNMYEKAWKHLLDLMWAFRLEQDEDSYDIETPSGSYERRVISNTVIAGQTNVKVEKQAYIDKSVFWKEAVREAMMDGLYDPNSPYPPHVRIKMLEARGLPTDIIEGENAQVRSARRQWIDFKDESIIPTIDKTLDDPGIHFAVLGDLLLSDDGREMSEAAGWPEIARRIAGWEDTFAVALQTDLAARQFYGGWQPPDVAEQMYQDAQISHQEAMAGYQQMQLERTALAQSDPQTKIPDTVMAPEPPPEPPPPPQFLPNSMEEKILVIWDQMMQMFGPLPQPDYPHMDYNIANPEAYNQQAAQKQQDFIKFRAVVEAYKTLADQAAQAQMMGMQETPAPSAQEGQRSSPFSSPVTPPEPQSSKM